MEICATAAAAEPAVAEAKLRLDSSKPARIALSSKSPIGTASGVVTSATELAPLMAKPPEMKNFSDSPYTQTQTEAHVKKAILKGQTQRQSDLHQRG